MKKKKNKQTNKQKNQINTAFRRVYFFYQELSHFAIFRKNHGKQTKNFAYVSVLKLRQISTSHPKMEEDFVK